MTEPTQVGPILRMVEELNAAHGLRFVLHGRCASGLQGGAWTLADASGRLAVLKRQDTGSGPDIRRLAAAVAHIRESGYPTPAWIASGSTSTGTAYWVQECLPGRSATPLTAPVTELLLDVLERQAELHPGLDRDWSARVTAMALSDEDDAPRATLRGLGRAGTSLLARYDRLLADVTPASLPGRDLVHGDFNSCNILLHRGSVSGVIDIQDIGGGSRVVDYACLLREAYVQGYGRDVIGLIRRKGEAVAGLGALVLCVAAAAFFIVGFKLRHEPAAVPTVLARLHQLADDLAAPVRR